MNFLLVEALSVVGKAAVTSRMSGQPQDSSARPLSTRFLGIRSKLNPVVLQQGEKKAAVMPEDEDYDAKLAAAIKAAKRNGSARRQSK